jgi:DNA invertase Pin-like site-specific DNA recombinase
MPAKLIDPDVERRIVRLLRQQCSIRTVAAITGCARQTVRRIQKSRRMLPTDAPQELGQGPMTWCEECE